ncbi:MAG: hypothetical protein OQL16_01610 [Gammaproteobacteria bacterium]|nr:hypothetical protein [Gammaproteobacteria bacterium]
MKSKTPELDIPEWVRWIAQDSSGAWWGYSVEPLRNDTGWYENEVGRYIKLGVDDASNWQQSLIKVDIKSHQ